MALIKCKECEKEISDKAAVCPNCGCPLKNNIENKKVCNNCKKNNSFESKFCAYCGNSLENTSATDIISVMNNLNTNMPSTNTQKQLHEHHYESQAKCPQCGSTSLIGNKQGFGFGKAIAGGILLGGLGLLAGSVGAKNTLITCMNCGYKFKL